MSDLSGATEVGGAVVVIEADLTPLGSIAARGTAVITEQGRKLGQAFAVAFNTAAASAAGYGGNPVRSGQFTQPSGQFTQPLLTGTVATMAGGGGAANATFVANFATVTQNLGTTVNRFTQVVATLTQTMNAAMRYGGGGGGNGGGAGAGGGGGLSPYMNPLSARGLARLVGSGAIVYGALEASRVATGYMEAADTSAHPERVGMGWQDESSRFSVMDDNSLRHRADYIVREQGKAKRLDAWESVPVIGDAVKFADAYSGWSSGYRDKEQAAQRDAQANISAKNFILDAPERAAKRADDPYLSALGKMHDTIQTNGVAMMLHPNDPTVRAKYDMAVRESVSAMGDAAIHQTNQLSSTGRLIGVPRLDTIATLTGSPKDRLAAFESQREAGKQDVLDAAGERLSKYDDAAKNARLSGDTVGADNIETQRDVARRQGEADAMKYDADTEKLRAEEKKKAGQDERQMQISLNQLTAHSTAERLRIDKDFFAAELVEVKAAGKARLDAIVDDEFHADQRKAVKKDNQAIEDAAEASHEEAVRHERAGLSVRGDVAKARIAHRPKTAEATAFIGEMVEQLRTEPKELFEQAKAVISDEMQAEYQARFGFSGGGMAVTVGAGQVIGDPMGWGNRARDEATARGTMQDAMTRVRTMKFTDGSDFGGGGGGSSQGDFGGLGGGGPRTDNSDVKTLLQGIINAVQKIPPWGMV